MYSKLDEYMESVKSKRSFACKKNCDYCCYQLVSLNLPEALVIVHAIRKDNSMRRGFVKKIPAIKKEIALLKKPETSTRTWFKKNIPCIFLKDHLCSIYEYRPRVCRTQLAAENSPDNCMVTAKGPVKLFNSQNITKLFLDESLDLSKRFKIPWHYSPLQVALLHAWTNGAKPIKLSHQDELMELYNWSRLETK